MPAYDYDVLVVGAGQGGLPAAHMSANLGAKVALIEEHVCRVQPSSMFDVQG